MADRPDSSEPGGRFAREQGSGSAADAALRLGRLRRTQPADATLRNLLSVLSAKLELCSSLSVYQWEAETEGYDASADAFHTLAEAESRSCSDLIDRLREHLELRAAKQAGVS
jgi:hypothetical protein